MRETEIADVSTSIKEFFVLKTVNHFDMSFIYLISDKVNFYLDQNFKHFI